MVLLDLQQKMIAKARKKLVRAKVKNVGFCQADATALPFANEVFDVVFLVAVLGEVPSPEKCLQEIHKVLRPSGWLSITEQPGDPDFLPLAVVRAWCDKQGFALRESYGKRKNYTANLRKVRG
ncbi:MAG: class I SAM-dependent methyltransferase [Calditrichaeota bacterium]|nr:MAG: class I SAM-dependent methyltransferase [Calditrichota bacterium]